MKFSSDELVPFSETRSGLSHVIEAVMSGREFVITKHGKMTVALIAASQLYHFREMQRELIDYLALLDFGKNGIETKEALAALKRRVAVKREDFESHLNSVPNVPPGPGDELPKFKRKQGKQ